MAKRETKAERSARAAEVLRRLDEQYGTEFRCYLEYETPWQLLIAVILSAQCTDARVNIVTRDLFKKYDTLEKFAWASQEELRRFYSGRKTRQSIHAEPLEDGRILVFDYSRRDPLTGNAAVREERRENGSRPPHKLESQGIEG